MLFSTVLGLRLLILPFHLLLPVLPCLQLSLSMSTMVSLSAIPYHFILGSFLNFRRPWRLWIWDQLHCTWVIVLRVIVLVASFGSRRNHIVLSFSGLGTFPLALLRRHLWSSNLT